MPRTLAKSMNGQMLDILDLYIEQGGKVPWSLNDLARFAISNGHWNRHRTAAAHLCKQDFSRAFREQNHRDPQGRDVRTYHSTRERSGDDAQGVFWADMRTASPEYMELAFRQRRNQIVGACVQLKKDVDSYNETNTDGAFIQTEFNFTDDIREREQSGHEYRPNQPR